MPEPKTLTLVANDMSVMVKVMYKRVMRGIKTITVTLQSKSSALHMHKVSKLKELIIVAKNHEKKNVCEQCCKNGVRSNGVRGFFGNMNGTRTERKWQPCKRERWATNDRSFYVPGNQSESFTSSPIG